MKKNLIVAAVCAASLLAVAAESATKPSCLTVAAQDGHEPTCNPYAGSDWAMPHRNAYEQDSTPYPGPIESTQLSQQHVTLPPGALPFLQFSMPYADGHRAAWFSMVGNPDAERVGKIDATTGTLIDLYERPLEGAATPSGAYNVLDHAGRFIVGKGSKVNVYTDSVSGDRSSTIQKLLSFTSPPPPSAAPTTRSSGSSSPGTATSPSRPRTASSASSPTIRRRWTRSTCGP